MKILLCVTFCILFVSKSVIAQVSKVMPADANEFYNKSMPQLRPQLKSIVLFNAKAIKNRKINTDSLSDVLHRNTALKGMSNNAIQGILVLIMVQASKDADEDLKNMVLEISHRSEPKKEITTKAADKKEPKVEMSDVQNLKLQMIMDSKSDMAEEVSFVMKRISGTQQDIINNLK